MDRRLTRRAALALLVAAVAAAHLWLADGVLESRIGSGDAEHRPRRIEVAFVRVMKAAPPPVAQPARARGGAGAARASALAAHDAAAARARELARRARAEAAAASAAVAAAEEAAASAQAQAAAVAASSAAQATAVTAAAGASAPATTAPAAGSTSAPSTAATAPVGASAPAPSASAVAAASTPTAAASAAAAPSFEWPPSTRLSYTLVGNYRGRVEGRAQVEWLRSGSHYQVRLDLSVGPSFAPLVSRSVWSDGEITAQGLRPQRFDEETRVAFKDPRRVTIAFDGERIHLPDGREFAQPPGIQDSASQFVQLTWLFTTRPGLLAPGQAVDLPLALPRSLDRWTYDVLDHETLYTRFGAVDTLHVKPRREPRPGVEMTAEIWVAPSYQYLPLRILIHQSAETFVDLLIDQLPLQAEPGR